MGTGSTLRVMRSLIDLVQWLADSHMSKPKPQAVPSSYLITKKRKHGYYKIPQIASTMSCMQSDKPHITSITGTQTQPPSSQTPNQQSRQFPI